jgi:thioredoxin reductase
VEWLEGEAVHAARTEEGFLVETAIGSRFTTRKLLLATGVRDELPPLPGLAECWGISALHCPYCHGFEVRGTPLGILSSGPLAFEFARVLRQWSPNLTLFTNGPSGLTEEQRCALAERNITIEERELASVEQVEGQLQALRFRDGNTHALNTLFVKPALTQTNSLAESLGCTLNEMGLVAVDEWQRTSQPGIYAAGDNTTMFRALSLAIASGTKAGAFINKELVEEDF